MSTKSVFHALKSTTTDASNNINGHCRWPLVNFVYRGFAFHSFLSLSSSLALVGTPALRRSQWSIQCVKHSNKHATDTLFQCSYMVWCPHRNSHRKRVTRQSVAKAAFVVCASQNVIRPHKTPGETQTQFYSIA